MSIAHLFSALVLGCAYVLASSAGAAADLDKSDTEFMQKAAMSGMMEIEASQLAKSKAESPNVRAYAEQMVRDHTAVSKLQNELALHKDIVLPKDLSPDDSTRIDQLRDLQGEAFDRSYIQQFGVAAHEEAVGLFEYASRSSVDVDIKAFAAQTLPALRGHLQMAQTLQEQLLKDGK